LGILVPDCPLIFTWRLRPLCCGWGQLKENAVLWSKAAASTAALCCLLLTCGMTRHEAAPLLPQDPHKSRKETALPCMTGLQEECQTLITLLFTAGTGTRQWPMGPTQVQQVIHGTGSEDTATPPGQGAQLVYLSYLTGLLGGVSKRSQCLAQQCQL
jgi:hypothetical protein